MATEPQPGPAAQGDLATLLTAPATARAFRIMMWGYLCFLPLISAYVDAAGWLALLAGLRLLRLPRRAALGWIAAAGLLLSASRLIIYRMPKQPPMAYTALCIISLALSAVFLWLLCDTVLSLADLAGKRVVRAQTLTRRWLYILQVVLPLLLILIVRLATTDIARLTLWAVIVLLGTAVTTLVLALLANVARMCAAAAADSEEHPSA